MRNVASFPPLLDLVEYVLKITSCDNKAYFIISFNHNMQIHFQQSFFLAIYSRAILKIPFIKKFVSLYAQQYFKFTNHKCYSKKDISIYAHVIKYESH